MPQAVGNQAFQRLAQPQRNDPEAVQARLGGGRALDNMVRTRMESAFGADFSGVRLHTDASAGVAAQELKTRAFTVGQNVAFAPGEYQPGTLIGDALIAHELAHVLQQRGGSSSRSGKESETDSRGESFERDADLAATGAVLSLWGGAQGGMTGIAPSAQPSLRSGLRLSRCEKDKPTSALPKKSVTVNPTKLHGSTYDIAGGFTYANDKVYKQANVEVKKGKEADLKEKETKDLLGDDFTLEEYDSPSRPTAEEKSLFKLNQSSGAVTVYFVKAQSQGNTGESFWPSLGHGFVGSVVSNAGNEATFAHELGHVLLNDGGHEVPDDTYLMYASKKAGKYKLTPEQITKIRSSPYVT